LKVKGCPEGRPFDLAGDCGEIGSAQATAKTDAELVIG